MQIWLCWFQGEQDSSLSSRDRACIGRWREVAGSHEVIVLDKNRIDQILPEYQDIINACKHERSLQHKADLLRLLLLEKYGGIWSDTSVYPLESADRIIQKTTQTSDIFFYSFSPVSADLTFEICAFVFERTFWTSPALPHLYR